MQELTIEFRVRCKECKSDLATKIISEPLHRYGSEKIECLTVEPCKQCLAEARETVLDESIDRADHQRAEAKEAAMLSEETPTPLTVKSEPADDIEEVMARP